MNEDGAGLTLALWQGASVQGDCARAFAAIGRAAAAAGAAGASAIVFPELFTSGYERDDLPALALTRDQIAARLAPLAIVAGCAIVTGYPERLDDGIANSAICIGANGRLLANHRKIQLYGETEADRFQPGDSYTTFDLAGRRAAMLICYDVEFAPHVAALRDLGVDLILVPTANMRPFEHVGRHVVPAMAANHGLCIVYANYCGQEAHLSFYGGSSITGADGQVLAQAGAGPCLLVAALPAQHDPALLSTQARDLRQIAKPVQLRGGA